MSVKPVVSVAVVSDYRGGEDKSWNDLRATLLALASHDFDESVEFLLLENRDDLERMPDELTISLPGVRVIACDTEGSYEMKNIGARSAGADLLMILDADCIPDSGWIRAGVETMRRHPQAVAASGRTTYPGRSTLEQALGLLSRSYVDRGDTGPVRLLSTNNMIVRRELLCAEPFPEDTGPFAYRLVTERWLQQGGQLYFEPGMRTVHDFEGWPMERDMRRQVGWTSMRIRQLDAAIPGAMIVRRLGVASIPLLYGYRMIESTGRCARLARHFGLNWWHLPWLVALSAYVHGLEVPGMLRALRAEGVGATVYR